MHEFYYETYDQEAEQDMDELEALSAMAQIDPPQAQQMQPQRMDQRSPQVPPPPFERQQFPGRGAPGGPPPFEMMQFPGRGVPGFPPGRFQQQPSGPPPMVAPRRAQAPSFGVFAVDPGAIRPCLFRFVYMWLNTGEQFWAWLIFVGRRSAAGWRWTGFRWVYFGVDLRNIESFICF